MRRKIRFWCKNFHSGDISYWYEQDLSFDELILQIGAWKVVLDALRNYRDVNQKVFNSRATVTNRVKMTKVMFVLITFGILNVNLDDDGEIVIEVARCTHSNTELAFNNDLYWVPINYY